MGSHLERIVVPFPNRHIQRERYLARIQRGTDTIRGWPWLGAAVTVEMARELISAVKIKIRTAQRQLAHHVYPLCRSACRVSGHSAPVESIWL